MTELDPRQIRGLSGKEIEANRKRYGTNELPSAKPRNIIHIAFEVLRDPIFLLLVASGLIYLFLGDIQEALMLLGFVFFIMAITLYQEHKTERALEALRDLSSPRALVIRDGVQKRIPGRDVVYDDMLVLTEGDRVPADAAVLWSTHLSVDESLLSGESVPVRKKIWDGVLSISRPGGDDLPFIYSGTLIVRGQGIAQAKAVGSQSELGKIGKALQTVEPEQTLLQNETSRLVRILSVIGFSLCVIVVIAYGLTRGNWLHGFLTGIALAMAILPNEFPVVLTIFLALGAWRISRKQVLTRRVPAIESLGAATVLCVDKTGTLTLNQMSVAKLFANGEFYDLKKNGKNPIPENFHALAEFGILASQRDPFDPIERALKGVGDFYLANTEHLHFNWKLIREYPLSTELLALSHVWESPDGEEYVIGAKGAPEAIFDLCHMPESVIAKYTGQVQSLAAEGLRVLGVAKSYFKKTDLPGKQHDFTFEFLGLIGFADPIRPSVPAAVKECYSAGIRVVMITGDYPATAQSIARQIGLNAPEQLITGPELDQMSDTELEEQIQTVNIFARVVPEQKLRLVKALKAGGEVVAMTGDGVNDAPALKAANIGIAMGGRGTDVARESASLVLVDDDFSSIVEAVKMGRRIFDNLKKAMVYLLAIHIPIAGISLIPVLFKLPLVLMPVHIAFLHLIIDPSCSVVFEAEPEESNVMNRPPRNPVESLFSRRMVGVSLLQGLSILSIIAAVFIISLFRGQGETDARALTFTTLIVANLSLILTNRSWSEHIIKSWRSQNVALGWVIGGAILSLGLILYVPFLRDLFRFSSLHAVDLLLCVSAGIVSILWFEGLKLLKAKSE